MPSGGGAVVDGQAARHALQWGDMRLDRLIRREACLGGRAARSRLATGLVRVNGEPETDGARRIGPFDRVELGGTILRAREARHVMLHKPAGWVSATVDAEHPTVVDLIREPWAGDLHLAGRLDRATTGLIVLTNDSRFSEALTRPESRIPKTYLVATREPISREAIDGIRGGILLEREGVTTHPAGVERLAERRCRLTIFEGKHHQVKRMFARFGIRVEGLHREAIGGIALDSELAEGEYRELDEGEVAAAMHPHPRLPGPGVDAPA